MNTFSPGLSDSLASVLDNPLPCPHCDSSSHIAGGLCVGCLLETGLDRADEDEAETLTDLLAELRLPDQNWRLGNYEILEEIGRGGMGVIYRARQRHSQRIVAVKRVLSYQADSRETLLRFRREAQAAASLDHSNILPIYEVSESEDGLPFFSMKFAPGGTLQQVAPALRKDPRQGVALVAKVARAVQYAHSKGILHRDLKPGNILLDARGEPLVSDFGLAKWLDTTSDVTRTLTIFGTPGYIAPEQLSGRPLTPAADVYSLGAILFDLLASRPPFLGDHALSVIHQASETPAPKLRSISRTTNRDLETICAKALEREPRERYRSAGAFADDLESWLDGRPVLARRVLPSTRAWRWSRRNPHIIATAAICLALGATAIWFVHAPPENRPRTLLLEQSIAVLPFENLGDEKENQYFSEGVQNEILNDLAKVADLKVISRTSVMQYRSGAARNLREIARTLGVSYVLEGSVQRASERVRVRAQLIDARTDRQIWAEEYDREVADVFALESELAQQIVAKLHVKLSAEEKAAIEEKPTTDVAMYELYLRARDLIDAIAFKGGTQNLLEAKRLLDTAVARDPAFLLAHCQLARAHDDLYLLGIDHTPAQLARADKAVQNVLRLRPNAGEAHLASAQHLYKAYRDYAGARRELNLARRALPNEPFVFVLTGYVDRRQGRWNESTQALEIALKLDPRNLFIFQQLCYNYQYQRRFPDMAAVVDRVASTNPEDVTNRVQRGLIDLLWHANPHPLHVAIQSIATEDPKAEITISNQWMYLALCERDKAAADRVRAIPNATDACRDDAVPFPVAWCEGVASRSARNDQAAHAAFARARTEIEDILRLQPGYPEGLCVLGMIDAALGNKDEAITEGRRAVALLPTSKDSMNGPKLAKYLAVIYAWTGETKQAVEQLTGLTQIPSDVNYGDLRLNPAWDPLRGEPSFESMVASLAPEARKP